jgi:hypothetical protein
VKREGNGIKRHGKWQDGKWQNGGKQSALTPADREEEKFTICLPI